MQHFTFLIMQNHTYCSIVYMRHYTFLIMRYFTFCIFVCMRHHTFLIMRRCTNCGIVYTRYYAYFSVATIRWHVTNNTKPNAFIQVTNMRHYTFFSMPSIRYSTFALKTLDFIGICYFKCQVGVNMNTLTMITLFHVTLFISYQGIWEHKKGCHAWQF